MYQEFCDVATAFDCVYQSVLITGPAYYGLQKNASK
jgi:hypothetical protein